jgi:hypothetical protein
MVIKEGHFPMTADKVQPTIVPVTGIPETGIIDTGRFVRRFTGDDKAELTMDQVQALQEGDFIDYLRERLWDKMAQERYSKPFDQLEYAEKVYADLMAIIAIAKVQTELEQG